MADFFFTAEKLWHHGNAIDFVKFKNDLFESTFFLRYPQFVGRSPPRFPPTHFRLLEESHGNQKNIWAKLKHLRLASGLAGRNTSNLPDWKCGMDVNGEARSGFWQKFGGSWPGRNLAGDPVVFLEVHGSWFLDIFCCGPFFW